MLRLASSIALLAALFVSAGLARPAFAQPADPGCASPIDDLGALVDELDGVLGANGGGTGAAAAYGALGGHLDRDTVAKNVASLSNAQRKALAGQLLTIALDPTLTGECSKDQVRYNAAMVLFELAKNASGADRAYFVDCLLQAANAEKDPVAKRQMVLNLDKLTGSMSGAQKSAAAALVEEYLPSSPDYSGIFGENGDKDVVNVVVHAGDETFEYSKYDRVFENAGATVKKNTDGSLDITYKVTPDDPTGNYKPVTYKIKVIDEFRGSFSNLDIFDKMDSNDPAIEVYNFHSQYGSGLSKSIREGAENPDSKKLFLLGSCKSKVNAGRLTAKYPKMNSIFTRDSEYFTDTPKALKTILTELVNRPNYRQIGRAIDNDYRIEDDNYFYPNDRRRLAYMDSDFDGIPDLSDTGANCALTGTPQSMDFAAKDPGVDASKLNGEKLLYAIAAANGVLGYSDLVKGLEDKYVADGFAPADPDGPMFTFTKATEDGPFGRREIYRMKTNAAYSHLADTALAGAALREIVAHDRTKGGTRELSKDDEILSYMMGVKLFDAWSNQSGSTAYSGYQEKFSLGKKLSLWDISGTIDHDNGVTRETITKIKEKLGSG